MDPRVKNPESPVRAYSQVVTSGPRPLDVEKDLPRGLLQSLLEKNYEKRKQAGHNLQRLIKEQNTLQKSSEILERYIVYFSETCLLSPDEAYKQAGLMAFSAIASCLSTREDLKHIERLVSLVLASCKELNSKVRYYAVESLYNIIKVHRQNVLFLFPQCFKTIVDLCLGSDKDVRKASKKLDSLLKTIVVECEANSQLFNAKAFMSLIEKMATAGANPYLQRIIVAWLTVLDSIPDFNLFNYISHFLKGVFLMLNGPDVKLNHEALIFIKDLLVEIKNDIANPTIDLKFIMETCVEMITLEEPAIKKEAITWINELIEKGERIMIRLFPLGIKAALECISDSNTTIADKAEATNHKLLDYCRFYSAEMGVDFGVELISIVEVLMHYIEHNSIKTREVALEWVIFLQNKSPESLEPSMELLVRTLSSRLNDPDNKVINSTLIILCKIAQYKEYFDKVISSILNEFSNNHNFSTESVKKTIKSLCQALGTELVYKSIAEFLYIEKNLIFYRKIVEVLNDLLLIDSEFEEIRERLKYCIEDQDEKCIKFFHILYKAWCVSPGCVLTLTLLVQYYGLAYEIVSILYVLFRSKVNIDLELLQQLASLVQLIDSPVFVRKLYSDLRMQMLEHHQHPYLLKCLYALLMVLPHSRAYKTLKLRLKDISSLQKSLPLTSSTAPELKEPSQNEELVQFFVEANASHKKPKLNIRV